MKVSRERYALFYLILLFLSIYTPKYGVMDRMSVQFFLLSVSNFVTIITIPFIFSINKSSLKSLFNNKLILVYSGVIIISLLSMIKSINIVESLVKINQLTVFLSLVILTFFAKENLIKARSVLWIILISLIVDIAFLFTHLMY